MRFGFVAAVMTGAVVLSATTAPALAKDKPFPGVSSHIKINAEPSVVYECIRQLRNKPDSGVKELKCTEHQATLEESFCKLPVVNTAKCTYVETYTPDRCVAYKMLNSDKFKAFEGQWKLTEIPGEKATDVELQTYVLLDLPVPFLRQLTNTQTIKGVKERLTEVKKMAESKTTASTGSSVIR